MKYNILKESEVPKVAIIFGRFNPPHKGHKGAWEKAAQYDNWYVGTNPNTVGAKTKSGENKDPLPYELKVAAMEAIMPEIKGHIIPESTWWSLATAVYNKHGKVHLVIISDPEDGAGFVKGLLNSNGKEGRHGYYNFADITHDAAPRASSATALRAAVANDDRDAFAQAAGVDPEFKVQGRDFFDLVSHYLIGKEMKESSLGKIVRESTKAQYLDIEVGDKVVFYYSKQTPRMPATVVAHNEKGGLDVEIDNGRVFSLGPNHEVDYAETLGEAESSSYRFYVSQEQWNEAAKQLRLMKYADYTATKTSEGYIELVFTNKDEAYDAVLGLETGDIEVLDADERIFQESKKKKMPKQYKELVGEAEGKLVKNMRVQHIHNGKTGTVVKGGDKAGGRVEVEWNDGTTTVTSGKYLEKAKNINEVSPELLDRAARKAELASNKSIKAANKALADKDMDSLRKINKHTGKKQDQSIKFANKAYDKRKKRGTPYVDEMSSTLGRIVSEDPGYISVGGDRYDGGLFVTIHYPNGEVVDLDPIDGEELIAFDGKQFDGVMQLSKHLGLPIQREESARSAGLEEGVNDPHIFKAVFLAGGPGSGKSYVVNKLMSHTGLKVVNSDDIYEFLMKKQNMPLDPETIFSPQGQEIRGKAKELTAKKKGNFLDGRLGLIIDGTGKDVEKVRKEMSKLKEMGYDCMMLFVNTSLDVAQERNMQRERSLAPEQVQKMWQAVQDNIMKFQQVFGAANFVVLDNSGGLEDPTRAKEFQNVFKQINAFVNTAPKSHIAKKWIDQQKGGN